MTNNNEELKEVVTEMSAEITNSTIALDDQTSTIKNQRGMKWHNFLVNFWLIFNMVLNVIAIFYYLFGFSYFGYTNEIYGVYPALRLVDISLVMFSFLFAIYSMVTRAYLMTFDKKGPLFICLLHGTAGLLKFFFTWLVSIIIDNTVLEFNNVMLILRDTSIISGVPYLLAGLFMVVLNYIYYRNRRDLFN